MKRLTLALLFLAPLGCFRAAMSEVAFPPGYAPALDEMPTAPACAAFAEATVKEGRANPKVIGYRYSEDSPQNRYPISMSTDPAGWAKQGLEAALRRASLAVGPTGKTQLAVTLSTLDLEERTFHNSSYEAKLVLDVTVTLAGGAPCWSGRVDGFARNYGSAGNPANYRETVNHALDRATSELLANHDFLDAACGVCGGAGSSHPGPVSL